MTESGKGKERRRDDRFPRSVPVRVGHDHTEGVKAESINISPRGLYCKVPRYVQPFSKTRVCLELTLADGNPTKVECDGVVVRVEPDEESAGVKEYCLAIYFLDLDRKAAQHIEDYLDESH